MKSLFRLFFQLWLLPAFGKFLLTPTITYVDATGPVIRIGFNLVASGAYSTGGDTINLQTAAQDPAFVGQVASIESLGGPIDFDVWDAGGNIANGVFPVKGSTSANSKAKFTSAFNTELSAGAYPGSITGATLMGEAVFNKL
jgi:hypothetical protein